ncbi:fungal pheromone STE3G-protein-coupled receptor [Armillaria mellea]|nr:fungal pheromone STE3G-protein-coupled receptor [Armillaria mellea]
MQLSDPTYPLFPIFAFLGFILPLIPLPWHLKAYNSGTCYYMIWASIACLNQFVNSIVWADNVTDWAPIWCDISIRIMLGSSVGLPAASLCINRRLFHIATSQVVVVTQKEKRRAVLIDTFICVLFPLVFIAMQYIVQGHRFNIFEGIGCYPALYNTPLMYVISAMWPIIIGLISSVYCVLTLRAFSRRRLEFSKFLSSNRSLSVGRYFRLMALAMTEICFTMPLAIFMIWLNTTATPIGPWRSWADTHFAFSRVERYPALIWRQSRLLIIAYEFTRWVNPVCALVFFAYFGFADEARKNYRAVWWKGLGLFGIKPKPVERKVGLVESVG